MISETNRLTLQVVSDSVTTASSRLSKFRGESVRASDSAEKLSATSRVLNRRMALLSGAILAGVTAQTVKTTREWLKFNTAMNEVETIAGVTTEQFGAIRKEAAQLAVTLGVDATEAAQGYYQAISAGVAADDATEFIRQSGNLARAGVSTIEQSTSLLTTALNSYGISAEDATAVSDQLFTTVRLGVTTIPQLAQSFSRAGNIAANSGVELNELLGIVASLTKQGAPTAEAFTQVKASITALLNPSKELELIYDRLGVSGGRQLIEQEGLAGALDKVRTATAGNDTILIKALRSTEAYNGALGVTGEKLKSTQDAIEEVGNADGAVAEAAVKNASDWGTSLQRVQSAFVLLGENIESATGLMEKLTKNVNLLASGISDPDLGKNLLGSLRTNLIQIVTSKNATEQLNEQISQIGLTDEFLQQMEQLKGLASQDLPALANTLTEVRQQLDAATLFNGGGANNERIAALEAEEEITLRYIQNLEREDAQRVLTLSKLNQINTLLDVGQISLEEHARLVEEANTFYDESTVKLATTSELLAAVGIDSEKVGNTLSGWGASILNASQPLLNLGAELAEQNRLSLEADVIALNHSDDKLAGLEEQRDVLSRLLDIRGSLNASQQTALNILNTQIQAQRALNDEAAKSPQQRDFERVSNSLRTSEERAADQRDSARDAILNSGASEAEQQELLARNDARFNTATAPAPVRQFTAPTASSGGGGSSASSFSGASSGPSEFDRLVEDLQQQETAVEQSYIKRLELIRTNTEEGSTLRSDLERRVLDDYNLQTEEFFGTQAERFELEKESLIAFHDERRELIVNAAILTEEEKAEAIERINREQNATLAALEQERLESTARQHSELLTMTDSLIGGLATLGEEGSSAQQALLAVQKGISIAEAIINTEVAATKALALGPVLGIPASAAVRALGYASVGVMAAQSVGNFNNGGILGGGSGTGDAVTFNGNRGEVVMNFEQQRRLLNIANGGAGAGGGGGITIINQTSANISGAEETQGANGERQLTLKETTDAALAAIAKEAQTGGGVALPAIMRFTNVRREA